MLPPGMTFAAGAMLYIISHEIVPETHRHGHQAAATGGLMIGLILMMLLDVIHGIAKGAPPGRASSGGYGRCRHVAFLTSIRLASVLDVSVLGSLMVNSPLSKLASTLYSSISYPSGM